MNKTLLLFPLLTFFVMTMGTAQTLPKIFQLGENEKAYQELSALHKKTLLEACNNDIVVAFEHWLKMTEEMEAYSKKIQYELNGIKLWMHVFFEGDGAIKNIGYVLRQDSKNVDRKEFEAFLKSFMVRYQMPVVLEDNYAHYSIASFPVHVQEFEKN